MLLELPDIRAQTSSMRSKFLTLCACERGCCEQPLTVRQNLVFFLSLAASVFVRRHCFKHLWCFQQLSLIKFFKSFKTLHVSASIGHPQVLKLFVMRIADF
jgi:hypothetical protein